MNADLTPETETTESEATMPKKKTPHTTNRFSPRYRNIVPAKGGALADSITGEWTPADEQNGIERVEAIGYAPANDTERLIALRHGGAVGRPFDTVLTRGNASAARRAFAERLVAMFPGAARAGDLVYFGTAAVDSVEFVLAATDALGVELNVKKPRDLALACEYLLDVGRSLTWRSRFAWIATPGADPATAAVRPWGHLSARQLAEARRAYAEYLRARIERPELLRPTDGSPACFVCGVGEVLGLPSRAAEAWHTVTLRPHSLGGKPGMRPVETEVCAVCAAEAEAVGSYGPTMLDRLVKRAAGIEGNPRARDLQLSAKAWGVMGRKRANAVAFGHLDLARLVDDVRAGVIG